MKPVLTGRWAETPPSQRREPSALEISAGFACDPAGLLALLNELTYRDTDLQREVANFLTASGVTLSEADAFQVLRAIRSQRVNFVAAANVGGSANAITLAFSPTFGALADLLGTPLVFLAKAANTGPVTCQVDGLAAQPVTWPDGTALAAGDIANGALLIIRHDGAAFRMQQCLSPTQMRAVLRAQKSLYNVQRFGNGTRATLTGPGDGATWRNMFSGSYVKQGTTSNVLWSLSIPLWAPGNTATRQRFVIGGVAADGVTQYSFGTNVYGHMTLSGVVSGLPAGSQSWSADVSRPNDGVAWTTVVNPNSTDSQFFTSAGTVSSIIIQEFEP